MVGRITITDKGVGDSGKPKPCAPGFKRNSKGRCVKIETAVERTGVTPPKESPGSGFFIPGELTGNIVQGKPEREQIEISKRDFLRLRDRNLGREQQEQQQVRAKQLEEGTEERRAEEEERREGKGEKKRFLIKDEFTPEQQEVIDASVLENIKAGAPDSIGQLALDVATVTGFHAAGRIIAGVGGKAFSLGKNSITKSRGRLSSLAKSGDGLKIFGLNIGIKEMIFGGAIYSQRRIGNFVSDINTQATTMGTEKNEKVAREMISGLDPDTAIRIYEGDIAVLRDSEQTLQFIKIFFIADYIGLKVENTQLNIRNQIDGKLSRIAEAERFKLGLNIQDIQANLNAEESIDKNEV